MQYLKNKPSKYLMDGCKLFWYPDRLQSFLDGKQVMPITIDMGIHKSCNIRCKFCYGIQQKPSKEYIPTESLLQVANDAGKCDIKGVAIVGDGEPALNKGLYPFVRALTDNGVEAAVATNGLLISKKELDILTANCTWIRFNVSAIDEAYPKIHRGATLQDYRELERLIEYGVQHKGACTIGLQMVLIPECFDQIIPFAERAVELGVDYAQIKQYSDAGAGMPMHFDMNQYAMAEQDLAIAESKSTEQTAILIKWQALQDSKNITMNKSWEFERCADLPFLFQMSGNGDCYPCGFLFNNADYCYGNVIESNLDTILHSDKYWSVMDKIEQMRLEDLCTGQCRHCQTNKFVDKLMRSYEGNLTDSLIAMCGGVSQYRRLKDNPPRHLAFV